MPIREQSIFEQAAHIAAHLGQIGGVVAVALGGSWSRGDGRPDSDIDLGIYYHPDQPPSIAALRQLARELDDRHPTDAVTDFGEWGRWINGGGWLKINGQPVDWLYRDQERVAHVIDDCCSGIATCDYQPGHPHGFHNHIYLGEIFYCQPLYDPSGALAALKARATPYPPLLKQAILRSYLWQAGFALENSQKSARRGDIFRVSGLLFTCAACLVQVLFALNERYFINEKGAIKAIESFPLHPASFSEHTSSILACPGSTSEELLSSIKQLEEITQAVRHLCNED
jgi:predicted nucleotidyltransferase